jgi:hypothetical protein
MPECVDEPECEEDGGAVTDDEGADDVWDDGDTEDVWEAEGVPLVVVLADPAARAWDDVRVCARAFIHSEHKPSP